MEPLAFYARWKARMKSTRSCMERRSGTPCFLYAVMRGLKVIEVVWSVDQEPLALVNVLAHWPCVHSCVNPFHRSGHTCDRAKCH
jgi:hypothetical protein